MTSSGFPLGLNLPWGIYEKIAHQILDHYRCPARKIEGLVAVNVCAAVVRITTPRGAQTSNSAASQNVSGLSGVGRQPNASDVCARPNKGGNVTTGANANAAWLNGSVVIKPRHLSNQQLPPSLRHSARGHAARLIQKIFAIDQAVTIRFGHLVVEQHGTAVIAAEEPSNACVIVVANTLSDSSLSKSIPS